MEWKKKRVSITLWNANGFCITETTEVVGKPFRLESMSAQPEYFATLETAKAVASLQYDLALAREENEKRAQLEQRNDDWPLFPPDIQLVDETEHLHKALEKGFAHKKKKETP